MMAGANVLEIARLTSYEESVFMTVIARRAYELRKEELSELATEIRNQIVDAWNKGQS